MLDGSRAAGAGGAGWLLEGRLGTRRGGDRAAVGAGSVPERSAAPRKGPSRSARAGTPCLPLLQRSETYMKADVHLSTRFLTTQNAHQVGMLVSLEGDTAVRRTPINVSLVLDRSGSMTGTPLEAAKQAAARFASFLTPVDRLSIVVFDDAVATIFGPAAGGDPAAVDAIGRIVAGGSTNLSGGWLKGRKLVEGGALEGTNRVVLLTDGQANVGIVEPAKLVGLARQGLA